MRNKLGLLAGIAVMSTSILFTGCGTKEAKSPTESSVESTEKLTENSNESTDVSEADNVAEEPVDEQEEQITEAEAPESQEESAYDTLVGTYEYKTSDGEDCSFELFRVGDNYYLEYDGEYDYAGAELQINDIEKEENGYIYNSTLYPFSGFSFAGDYWGKGNDVKIIADQNGDLVISEGQPFLDKKELNLKRKDGIILHESQCELKKNENCPEITGNWRCISERDGEEHEITLIFEENGFFRAVDKVKEQPPKIYIGNYTADKADNGITGKVDIERFAYGGMPDEWMLGYDEEGKNPYVYSDYMYAEPFTYKEGDDMKLPFVKIAESEKSSIAPGPLSRADEVEKMFNEYLSGDGEDEGDYNGNEYADHEEIPESEYIEDVIYYAHAYTKAPICELDSVTDGPDGKVVTIHCYEMVGEGNDAHTATWDWISYHVDTGKYYDFFENEIDMSKY